MALILKNGAVDFVTGGPMDFATYVDESTDVHHIFPQEYCKKNNLKETEWNSVINKTPIFARSNRSIGGYAPSKYIVNIEKTNKIDSVALNGFIRSHCVDAEALRKDDFDTFFKERAFSLCKLIEKATGKSVQGYPSDTPEVDINKEHNIEN